jgi:hypothetical protein
MAPTGRRHRLLLPAGFRGRAWLLLTFFNATSKE